MAALTDAQIAALPEEWRRLASDVGGVREAFGGNYDPTHEVRISELADLLAALAEARTALDWMCCAYCDNVPGCSLTADNLREWAIENATIELDAQARAKLAGEVQADE